MKEKGNDYATVTQKTVPVVPLDSMLGNLQSDMSRYGVDTVAKGCCYCCHKPIVGQVSISILKRLSVVNPIDVRSMKGCYCTWKNLASRALYLRTLWCRTWNEEFLRERQ